METHVSSTTADVPQTQEVIGSQGNVELVIVVEKVEEEQLQKVDSNSQGNAQPVIKENNPVGNQPIKTDNSPSKQDQSKESKTKEVNLSKTTQPALKIQLTKKSTKNESQIPQHKLSDKQAGNVKQNAVSKEPSTFVDVDSTSPKDVSMDELDEVDDKDNITLNITLERGGSIDPETEVNCDASEKEHNKSISRELKSLINSAKESKIISECTKLTSKTRKSRAALESSNTSLTNTPEADSIQRKRRSSSNSQKSNSSEKSDRVGKRSMRSQNPEFVHKVKKFLNSVTGKFQRGGDSDDSSASDEEIIAIKNKQSPIDCATSTPKNRNQSLGQDLLKKDDKSNKLRSDPYCWRCHWSIDMTDGEKTPLPPLKCNVCPRAFHPRCLTGSERNKISSEKNWVCPECMTVLHAESSESRSNAMKKTSLGMLCELLKFALESMKEVNGAEPFLHPVDRTLFPDYDKYVVHPMDLSFMRENIREGLYGSTEAFVADSYWILHNSIIFNTLQSKMTTTARALVRACRTEMGEIEACPECYAAAHARRTTWFTEVCTTPHLVLWAKLKGFPYWPAKAMSVSHSGMVDVRFFGAHDRAWVPGRDCYLYSEKDPNNFRTRRQDLSESMQEAEQHIRNISRKYGRFIYAPYRTVFEPSRLEEQLKLMIPSFEGPVRSPIRDRRPKTPALGKKSRSNSKSSKDDSNVCDILSDSEAIEAETSKTSEEAERNEAVTPIGKTQAATTRKRQRSEAKELGGTATDSPKEKRRAVASESKETPKKIQAPVLDSSKETAQKQSKAQDASDEPIDIESEPASPKPTQLIANNPDTGAPGPTPNKSDAAVSRPAPSKSDSTPARPTPSKPDAVVSQPTSSKSDSTPTRPTPSKPDAAVSRPTPSKSDSTSARPTPSKPDAAVSQPTPSKSEVTPTRPANKPDATPTRQTPGKPDVAATGPTPSKPDAAAKTNKNNSKTNDVGLTPNKTPAKIDTVKINEKEKSAYSKSLTNIDPIEVGEINTDSPPTNKTPTINVAKMNTNTNKDNTKEPTTVTKTVEKEKAQDSAVLIKISEKGNKDAPIPNKTDMKENLTEAATITKITDIVKVTPNKNKGKEKETENTTTTTSNKDNAKEKVTVSSAPVKTAEKVANTVSATPRNKNLVKEKINESPTATNKNTVNEKSTEVSTPGNNPGPEKIKESASADKTTRAEKSTEDGTDSKKDNADKDKSASGKNIVSKPSNSKVAKATKDRKIADDTSLAVIARKIPKSSDNDAPVATTSGARSVTAGAASDSPAAPPATRAAAAKTKTTQITVEVNPDSNIFTPTSTDNVRNMKEAVDKLQKLRTGLDPPATPQFGRVGVRSFARMTSPESQTTCTRNDVFVEIKTEPMDYEDAPPETSVLDSLRPRPIAPAVSVASLREVRVTKVMPVPATAKKGAKTPDARPRAKKTFPQPKKPDDGRAELTNKNSMVYIPIQPPASQAPVRAALKATVHAIGPSTSSPTRTTVLFPTTNVKGVTMAPPLLPMAPPPPPPPLPLPPLATTSVAAPPAATSTTAAGALAGAIIAAPGFPTVPTTVHTVPLITSVNGQWTFSLQPVMSVGGGDSITSPTVNGMGERPAATVAVTPALVAPAPAAPANPAAPAPSTTPSPATSMPPALVPTGTPTALAPSAPVIGPPDAVPGEPPQLQQRPVLQNPLAAGTEIGEITAPSTAGPLTAKLNQNSIKLAEFFRTLLEDSLVQVEEPSAEAAALRLQLEQARWQHQHELSELRHTHELLLVEVRSAMEKEKTRAVAEARRLAHQELEAAVKDAKSKQWCSNCGQEAQFYCCWNTSYCDYPCQRAHWAKHFSKCTQQRTTASSTAAADSAPETAQPTPPADVPKTTSAPSLTVAGKVTSMSNRLNTSEQTQNKTAALSTNEEGSGLGGTKSAGASPAPPAASLHASPLLANKQLISNEESGTKRVVTSGGYLIVGSGAGAGAGAAVVAPPEPRRAPRRD